MSTHKRITKIELHNYRAFYGTADNYIDLPKGENLLIYGENGSGKSSLFRAMEDFFQYSDRKLRHSDKINFFGIPPTAPPFKLAITFTEFGQPDNNTNKLFPYELNSIPEGTTWVYDSYLASGFFSYKHLLRTHLDKKGQINFFELLVNNILSNYPNAGTGTLLSTEWSRIEEEADKLLKIKHPDTSADSEQEKKVSLLIEEGVEITKEEIETRIGDLQNRIEAFNKGFIGTVKSLESSINKFNDYFNHGMEIVVEFSSQPFGNLRLEREGAIFHFNLESPDERAFKTPIVHFQVRME